MGVRRVQTFIRITHRNDVHKTDQVLGVSRPTLDGSVRRLRRKLTTRLFFHHDGNIALASTNRDFCRRTDLVLRRLHTTRRSVHRQRKRLTKRVGVNVKTDVSHDLVPTIVSHFRRRRPRMGMHVVRKRLISVVGRLHRKRLSFAVGACCRKPCSRRFAFRGLLRGRFTVFYHPKRPTVNTHSVGRLLSCD